MKAISLFAGAGGLDTGFEKAGFDIIWANEIDHDAAATWKANRAHADVMHEGDIADRLSSLSAYRGADIVFGGPPCQGFSVAGKMDASDPRSELIFTFLSAVELVRPRFFVMENVAALGRLDRWVIRRTAKYIIRRIMACPKKGTGSSFSAYRVAAIRRIFSGRWRG